MILITGSSGLIGSSLLAHLPDESIGISRKAEDENNIKFDLAEPELIDDLIKILSKKKIDQVIHCAGVTPWSKHPDYSKDIKMAESIAKICNDLGVKKIIFISGWNVYDMSGQPPFDENTSLNPKDDYGKSKQKVENYFLDNLVNTKLIALRTSSIYGPGQTSAGLIPNLVEAALVKQTIQINAKATRRDYLLIEDFIKVCQKLLNVEVDENTFINIGSGQSISVMEVANTIKEVCEQDYGLRLTLKIDDINESPLADNKLDISRAKEMGLIDKVTDFSTGIGLYIKWFSNENNL